MASASAVDLDHLLMFLDVCPSSLAYLELRQQVNPDQCTGKTSLLAEGRGVIVAGWPGRPMTMKNFSADSMSGSRSSREVPFAVFASAWMARN